MLKRQLREQNYPFTTFTHQQPVLYQQQASPAHSPNRSPMGSFSSYHSPTSLNLGCGNCKATGDCACIDDFAAQPHPFTSPAPFLNRPPQTSASQPAHFQNMDPFADRKIDFSDHKIDVVDRKIDFADREIDFTARFARSSRPDQQPSLLATNGEVENPKCGFCTDDVNCICRDQSLQQLPQEPVKATGPGSCDACQTNPKQRAWCQRVAQLRNDESMPTPNSRASSIGSVLDTLEPHIPDASTSYGSKTSIGCSDAFKLFDGRVPMDSDQMGWVSQLRTVPNRRDTVTQQPREYSAVELDTAGIIATLSNTMNPIRPRPEDGENVDIVRIAQKHQRETQSPHTNGGYGA